MAVKKPETYFLYHLHSDDSLLDSCTKYTDYIDLVKRDGGTAIATTEHGLPRGYVSKWLACKKAGLKFVYGVEIYLTEQLEPKVRDNYHTVLLARNAEGARELNRLITMSSDEQHKYYDNRLSFEEFLGISDNIIKTSACLASPLNKLEESNPWYFKLLKHYDYLEVQPHNHPDQIALNKKLAGFSKQFGIPLIAGTDTHSSSKYKAECRAILIAGKRKPYGDEDSFDLSYKTLDELVEAFRVQGALSEDDYLTAIENTNAAAAMCEDFELDTSIKYPILNGTPEEDERVFEKRVWDSLDEKLREGIIPKEQEPAFRAALVEELRVLKKLKMCGFMLSMSDLTRWCRSQGFALGPARGSVGGSRAAYVTDIIDLNPEIWHTVFSRFANEDRVEVGDIDIDCVIDDRPAIFKYITKRFGEAHVGRVAAYGTLADKSVVDLICRAFAATRDSEKYSIANSKRIKAEFAADEQSARDKYPEVFYYYDGLAGTKISQSVHPAGMVISPIDLTTEYGMFLKDGEMCLLLDMDEAHDVGAVKYDFLALKSVKVIRDTCEFIGIPYPRTHEINWNDQAVWQEISRVPTGIFQFESSFGGDCLKKFNAKSIFDMSLVTACIRPSGASYRDQLLAHHTHKNPSKLIDDILKDNAGFLVYQEDILRWLGEVCGLTGSEADTVRRGIAKKKMEILDDMMPKILDGYCSKSDQPREVAEEEVKEYLKIIEDASSYMFGYNHSIAYCLLGYLFGYYRHYYPMEFITAYSNNAQNSDDIDVATKLMRIYGVTQSNPKFGVSRSDYFFDKETKTIYKGLSSVKYIGSDVAEELFAISQAKTYRFFTDLLMDLNHTTVDSRQIDILVKIDYFSMFGNQRELFKLIELFELFKKGEAKQIKRSMVDGTALEQFVCKHAVGTTKSGSVAKSYTLLDVESLLHDLETYILSLHMDDLEDTLKVRNFKDVMGYAGYISNRQEDRPKLYVDRMFPLNRKSDGRQFGYSLCTKSIGSGIESRFTVFNRVFNKAPVKEGDIIYCKGYTKDGPYFTITAYDKIC